ncbi:allatostatins [Diaphorina citri]|uniref:Allatostatins n=1 Tax=Diaphorina citri TaxID=121845 RepID=A0A2U9PG55_DIACI|nr:allatostatins [Diaphorina citri]AWT50585.1 AstA [Diaphorina citri]KAI5703779.1 hypothetical protein M8J75_016108 [Diaphorina citri]KAI5732773.1 hypothetical protein M8J76_004005 [Diaphorina citri]KAI5739267.1 hypothetical protein M8J77_017136 [Diaphorina citri]
MLVPVLTLLLVRLGLNSLVCGEQFSSEFDKRLYDFGIGKRAYSYIMADHKRLPSYNFGLGKRGLPENKMYSFGLGKRLAYSKDLDSLLADQNEDSSIDKRGKQYSFGLGKRLKQYSFGLGKRFYDNSDYDEYVKRGGENHNRFAFGIGKRDVGDVAYEDSGLEKTAGGRYHQKLADEYNYH